MRIKSIITDQWKADGGACFGVVPKTIWGKMYPCDDLNLVPFITRILFIEWGNKKILIDSGMGRKQNDKYYQYKYLWGEPNLVEELNKLNIRQKEITDIIFTHLHDDHVGGASYIDNDNLIQLTFPNANYWISREQWEWANHPNPREKASFIKNNLSPLASSGKLNLIDTHNLSFIPPITFKIVNGHTRGQLIPFIQYQNKTIVFAADFIPSAGHLPIPYIASYDIEPLLAMQEKELFLNDAAKNNYVIVFEHDALYECCDLKTTEKGIVMNTHFKLSDICK